MLPETATALPPFPTRSAFRAWLITKGGAEMTGHCTEPGTCPLKAYLDEVHTPARFDVGSSCWGPENMPPGAGVELPTWAERFIYRVDRLITWSTRPQPAKAILAILDEVPTDA